MTRNAARWLLTTASMAGMAMPANAQAAANGFVTRVESAAVFDVGSVRVVIDAKTECGTAPPFSIATFRYFRPISAQHAKKPFVERYSHSTALDCGKLGIVVGSPVYFDGVSASGVLRARDVIRYVDVDKPSYKVNGGALEEEDSTLQQTAAGWSGTMWIDGYPLVITPETKLFAEPLGTKMDYVYRMFRINTMPKRPQHAPPSAMRAELLKANHWASYKAVGAPDGRLMATEMHFWSNQAGPGESTYLDRYKSTMTPPDYKAGVAGTLQYSGEQAISIVPDENTQDWITGLGDSLTPAYQKDLTENDPAKIHFHFLVVAPFVPKQWNFFLETNGALPYDKPFVWPVKEAYDSPRPGKVDKDVLAVPDGTVLVPATALTGITSEAQMAFLLSSAISSIVQKEGLTTWRFVTGPHRKRINGVAGGNEDETDYDAFSLFQSGEILRLAVRSVIESGYDPAPGAYASAALSGKAVANPVWIPGKRPLNFVPDEVFAYIFSTIRRYYAGTDFGSLKQDSVDFAEIQKRLAQTPASAKP